MKKTLSQNLVNCLALAVLPISILMHAFWLPGSISVPAISDSGYMSIITLTFLACVFVALLTLIFNSNLTISRFSAVASAYVVLIYFLREADVHRLLTIEHVTRPKFYYMESVPIWQKALAAAVFILLAICLLYLLIKYIRRVWHKFRDSGPWAVALVLWFVVLLISQLCDKSGLNHTHVGRVIEENSECWAALFLFLAIIQFIPTLASKRSQSSATNVLVE